MFCSRFLLIITIVVLNFSRLACSEDSATESDILNSTVDTNPETLGQKNCSPTKCIVRANITLQSGMQFPVVINCASLNKTDTGQRNFSYSNELNDLFLNRYKNIHNISMDGRCSNVLSFSLEHFPDANVSLEVAIFRNFRIDVIRSELLQSVSVVKELVFENNKFDRVESRAFEHTPLVTEITFQRNHLKHIDPEVFDQLTNLRTLKLYEDEMSIESEDFFQSVHCEELAISIKKMPKAVFVKLPKQLTSLQINNMSYDAIELHNSGNISSLLVFDNKIPNMTVIDNHNLKYINLSNNFLEDFKLVNCSQVQILCLTSNRLKEIGDENFAGMESLKYIYLQENGLKTLSTDLFQSAMPVLLKIDLSNNSLHSISIEPHFNPNPALKIILKSNPWDCRWILMTYDQRPDIFRIFEYERFASRINVNGLQCMVYPSYSTAVIANVTEPANVEILGIEPEYSDDELERTIRRHILYGLIVVAGVVAILSLILYVWTKCRRMVRLPFYESLKPFHWSPERFDELGEVPLEDQPDYEIPLEFFNSNANLDHVELLDTIGCLEPIDLPDGQISEKSVIYEEIQE